MIHLINRRRVVTATGLALLLPAVARAAPPRKTLALELVIRELSLKPGQVTSAWRFAGDTMPRFTQGDELDVTITNRLPVAVFIGWRGLNGASALEPLLARGPIAAGATETFALTLRHAGTMVCDARLTAGQAALPLPVLPIVVAESKPPPADRDAVLLIEDWRLQSDGGAVAPGSASSADAIYTVNGRPDLKIDASTGERLRLRFINGAQRAVLAVQLDASDVRVVAIDGQPAEPFPARDGRLVMAPGTRIDVIVDIVKSIGIMLNDGVRSVKIGDIAVTGEVARRAQLQPPGSLPSNGLPERLSLQSALRLDVRLDKPEWVTPAAMRAATEPAFRVKRDRTVVLALSNPTEATVIFHLHGHHMRLLDRLDDGWKPFWLDTVAVPAKQTLRVAFAATYSGAFLMQMMGTDWNSPQLLRSYLVTS